MNKEPLSLYIFRFLVWVGMLGFMAMLYWSSALLEDDLRSVKTSLSQIQHDLSHVQLAQPTPVQSSPVSHRSHIDPSLPNLLTPDPFYETTLPQMLGPGFQPHGVRREAIVGKPDNLHPFSNWSNVLAWVGQCNVALAAQHIGIYDTLGPDMAIKIEQRIDKATERPEFWVHLRENVYWEPLSPSLFSEDISLSPEFQKPHPVTAEDFKFYFDAMMNPWVQEAGAVASRTYYSDIEEMRIIDPLTLVIRWKSQPITQPDGSTVQQIKYSAKGLTGQLMPLPSFVYKYFADGKKILDDDSNPETYRTNSVWAQNFNEHWARNIIVSCGPWIFIGMTERQIAFKRNPNYFNPLAVLVEGQEVAFQESPDNVWQAFQEGKLDNYALLPEQIVELEAFMKSPAYLQQASRGLAIHRLDFVGRTYNYVGWNEARPFFQSARVRQALTMAIDRKRIITQTLNGLGIEIQGPFSPYSKAYDKSLVPWPYDPQVARAMLEKEGWYDRTGSGIISKQINGIDVPFRFTIIYYVKSPIGKSVVEYISGALKELGIDAIANGVDIADLSSKFDDKDFDAVFLGWAEGTPPEDPRQLWSSSGAKEKGSSNAIGFANPQIDRIIDQLQYEYNEDKRIALYHQFDQIIFEEAPYTFLYNPKSIFVYREYLQNVFIPAARQDLIPGADVPEPISSLFWIKEH